MGVLSFHNLAFEPILNGLKNTHAFVTKAVEDAQDKNIDLDELLTGRLISDMEAFRYQIYRATDTAWNMPPKINPKIESMTHANDEQTFPELLARLETTIKYIEDVSQTDIDGLEGNEVIMHFGGGAIEVTYDALHYVIQFAHPNFW